MCIVLIIIVLLLGVSMPAMESAFTEQGLRSDSHQLALMVRTAMIQSAEQHRNYVVELDSASIALHPQDPTVKPDEDATSVTDATDAAATSPVMEDVTATDELDAKNKLQAPDPDKTDKWIDMPPTTWVFQPGQLCPASRVRMTRGDAYVEMSFTPLTGNVENENAYFP